MKSTNKRQQILDAARRLIETAGIMRLTTKEIAREADCAEGTLFKYFKRKEDLCLAVVLESSPQFREAIGKVRPGKRTVANNLVTIGLASIDFFEKLIPLAVSLFADAALLARHRQAMNEQRRGPRDVFDLIAAYVEGEQELDRIDKRVMPMNVGVILLGACFHRVFIRQTMGKDLLPLSDAKFAAGVAKTLLQGLQE